MVMSRDRAMRDAGIAQERPAIFAPVGALT
jgi:hypothetical protein